MISIKEKIAGFEAKIAEQGSEIVAVKAAFDEYKADMEAKAVEANAKIEAMVADVEAKGLRVKELEDAMQAKDAEIASLAAKRDELKAKVELTPAVQDIAEGQEPVADGSVKAEEVDYVAEMNKLPLGSAEQIAFYRANKEKIDAAYSK